MFGVICNKVCYMERCSRFLIMKTTVVKWINSNMIKHARRSVFGEVQCSELRNGRILLCNTCLNILRRFSTGHHPMNVIYEKYDKKGLYNYAWKDNNSKMHACN